MTGRRPGVVLSWFVVVLLSVALNPGVLAASPHLDPPGAGDEQVILEYLLSHYADRPYIGVYESTEGLSLGEWRAVHRFSEAFYTRAGTGSLRSEIGVVENFWMAPLRHYSVTVGAIGVMGPEYHGPGPVHAPDFGVDLDDVGASDLVVHHPPGNLWFAVRGEDVSPLGDTAEVIGGTHSLSELQDIFQEWYGLGRWRGRGWSALVGSVALLLGLTAVVVARRRLHVRQVVGWLAIGAAVLGLVVVVVDRGSGTSPMVAPPVSATATQAPEPATAASRSTDSGIPAGATGESDVDGMEMVYVPAGTFLMGAAGDDGWVGNSEKPQRVVYLDAYWIDKTEVTNAMFERFVEATGPDAAATWRRTASGKPDHPVVGVNWFDADAYCRWAGRSLPTEAQWEKAARGSDGRKYPWGNEAPTRERCNFDRNEGGTTAVGKYSPWGDSPYGAVDMAGNAWEWVADWYDKYYYAASPKDNPPGPGSSTSRVLRGGSWLNIARFVRSSFRSSSHPDFRFVSFGFRCALP